MTAREQVLFETKSTYEHYAVVERIYEGRPARVLFSGTNRAAQSGIGLDDDPDLLFDYNQRLLEVANALYPKRILMIGGGAFTLPMALVAALPDVIVDVVELDPALQVIAEQYFGLQTDQRLRLHFKDGREYLEKTDHRYDLIIIDVFSELRIPAQFLTTEFTALLRQHVNETGAVALNVIGSYQGRTSDLIKSQLAAYNSVFSSVRLFPAAYGLTSWLPQNLILVAEQQPLDDLTSYVRFAPIEGLLYQPTDAYSDQKPLHAI